MPSLHQIKSFVEAWMSAWLQLKCVVPPRASQGDC